MARTLYEWIGKTDDTPVPPRVRLRVLQHFGRRWIMSTTAAGATSGRATRGRAITLRRSSMAVRTAKAT
jgi:hypothetical protein